MPEVGAGHEAIDVLPLYLGHLGTSWDILGHLGTGWNRLEPGSDKFLTISIQHDSILEYPRYLAGK